MSKIKTRSAEKPGSAGQDNSALQVSENSSDSYGGKPVDLNDLMREILKTHESNVGLQKQLSDIVSSIGVTNAKLDSHIESMNSVADNLNKKIETLTERVDQYETGVSKLSDELEGAYAKIRTYELKLESVEKRLSVYENERRRKNIIIDGLDEVNDNVRATVTELFNDLNVELTICVMDSVYRLGLKKQMHPGPDQ